MKKLKSSKHSYTFSFINLDALNAEKLFNILSQPENVELIVGKNKSYNDIWNVINFQDDDFKTYNYETIEYISDLDYDNSDEAYVVGFNYNQKLEKETLKDIYNNLFLPILKTIDDKIESSKHVGLTSEYVEVEREKFTL